MTWDKPAERIYAALQRCGDGWHTRTEIAAALNKKRLTPADVLLLAYLAQTGRVLAEQHPIEGPITVRWEYKIIEETK